MWQMEVPSWGDAPAAAPPAATPKGKKGKKKKKGKKRDREADMQAAVAAPTFAIKWIASDAERTADTPVGEFHVPETRKVKKKKKKTGNSAAGGGDGGAEPMPAPGDVLQVGAEGGEPQEAIDYKREKRRERRRADRERQKAKRAAARAAAAAAAGGDEDGEEAVEEAVGEEAVEEKAPQEKGKKEKGRKEKGKKDSAVSQLQQQMRSKLDGAQFRWINEQLYTTPSKAAVRMFKQEPELFDKYHTGFRHQVEKWPQNPVDIFIDYVRARPATLRVADFGCGEAKLAQSVPNKVFSFDLVAVNEFVTVADSAKVPLPSTTIDVAVFSLSLMGTNFVDFLIEAHRVLVPRGVLKIAEVVSRFEDVDAFIEATKGLGFSLVSMDDSNRMFVLFEFQKCRHSRPEKEDMRKARAIALKACQYKKR